MDILADILSSGVRAEIFRHLFTMERAEIHVRELERRTGFVVGSLQQELKKLHEMEIVKSRRDGNRLYYSARTEHPLFGTIQSLVDKTGGYVGLLKAELKKFPVQVAFIFGSIAKGKEHAESDIDFVVIGNVSLRDIAGLLREVTDKSGREVNPQVFTAENWKKRAGSKDHFVSALIKAKKTYLIGDGSVLKKLAK